MYEELNATEKQILQFEEKDWNSLREKEDKIREELDISPITYYLLLNQIIVKPAAMVWNPFLIKRLLKLRLNRYKSA